jgi:SAM-dependent methyltransferase
MIDKHFNPKINYPAYLTRRRLLEGISKHAGKMHGHLLDFGCGSKPYKHLFSHVERYVGLDFENPGHSHENEQIDVFYDGKTLPFSEEQFDCIFSSEVFEHVFNLPQILPQLTRVLKKGGMLLATCPFAICEHEAPNDFARYSSFGFRSMFEQNGFEVLELEKLGNSFEVMTQFSIIYMEFHVMNHFDKIPLFGKLARGIIYPVKNSVALLKGKILPPGKELYLNNLILCRKL